MKLGQAGHGPIHHPFVGFCEGRCIAIDYGREIFRSQRSRIVRFLEDSEQLDRVRPSSESWAIGRGPARLLLSSKSPRSLPPRSDLFVSRPVTTHNARWLSESRSGRPILSLLAALTLADLLFSQSPPLLVPRI